MLELAVLFFIFLSNVIHSKVENYLDKSKFQQLRNIDFIYMVNLDKRAKKRKSNLEQLASYGIIFYRFPVATSWNLPLETTNSIGIPNEPWRISYSIIMAYTQSDQISFLSVINNVISTFSRVFTDNEKSNYLDKILMGLTI